MKNRFGIRLDSNGYAPSLLPSTGCLICGRIPVARHEVFYGANRTKSKAWGTWINICPYHHADLHDKNPDAYRWLKVKAQKVAMERYNIDYATWLREFHKNYFEGEEYAQHY